MEHFEVNSGVAISKEALKDILDKFDTVGNNLGEPGRNTIKTVKFKEFHLNIKSFKVPNLLNQFAYKYLRKSKAERSFQYANILQKKGIGTPTPLAYMTETNLLGLQKSFYVCEHLNYDLTYRELVEIPEYEDHEKILRSFVHFTHQLHENNVLFKDHSPGNTLIKQTNDNYAFYLVDLNRMQFKNLSFKERMQNFSRLTPKMEMVKVMSEEYSKITGLPYEKVFSSMWGETQHFQEKFFRKKRLKKKLLFWKNYND